MPMRVDDKTQVQLVALRTEAQLLRSWMARRADVAAKRRDGPLEELRRRLRLLEREVPRLEHEGVVYERRLGAISMLTPLRAVALGGIRGAAVVIGAALWVVGVAALTPTARADDPFRLLASAVLVGAVALARGRSS